MIKRVAYILLLIFISVSVFSQKKVKIDLNPSKQSLKNIEVVQDISNGILISESISSIELVEKETKEGTFIELTSDKMTKSFDKGKPNLPLISRLIEIPLNKKPIVKVLSFDEEIIELGDYNLLKEIIPAQPSLSKSDDPEKAPFYKNKEIYSRNEFFKNEIVKFEDRGFLRNKHIGYIEISPFEYNPVENTLKILNNIEIEVSFVNDVSAKSINTSSLISPYFENILLNTINKRSETKALTSNSVKYVIVSDRMFEETLQPFVEWKTMKGFNVIEAYTDDANVGNTTTTIKAYLKELYENPDDGVSPTFVLLVGDVEQIPAFSGSGHVTDLYYCEYTGDKLPDVFYGRFSATSVAELQPQIDKTLEVEKYEMPDPLYLDNVVIIAGVDGTYAPTFGNGFVNYSNDNYTNTDNGINSYYYLYNDTSGVMASNNSGASSSIRDYISEGVSIANYTAHCGSGGWSNPSFSSSHVSAMTNEHMYPLMIGNCCLSNKFDNASCFGETLLRAIGKGAVGYIGGSNDTYWDEDYWWGIGLTSSITADPTYENSGLGVYDRFFHKNGEDKQDWYVTQGQINVAGNLAVEASASSRKAYYWEIYHLMGDPSLTPYVTVPEVLVASYNSDIIIGSSSFQVSAEEDAYVALSKDGVLLDSKIVDEAGYVELVFEPIESTGNVDIVITKQNRQPKIDEITLVPANTPYVVLDYFNINDVHGNNNSEVDYSETVDLDIQLRNLSNIYDAYNVIGNLSSADTNIVINIYTKDFGTILNADSAFVEKSFTIEIKNKFSDQQNINLDLEILAKDVGGTEYTWDSKIRLNVNAPDIQIGNVFIDDDTGNGDGIFDPGETVDISLTVSNMGSADLSNLNGLVSIIEGETHLTINNLETGIFSLNAQSTDTIKFNATANSETSIGTSVFVLFEVKDQTYNYYSKSESKELNIGIIPEIRITDNDSVIAAMAYFYDSGGSAGNYTNNENHTITLRPDDANKYLMANFLSFSVEPNGGGCWDYLAIYDGENTSSVLIGDDYCDSNTPTAIVATSESGALTFVFKSDDSVTRPGWEAEVRSFIGSDYQVTVQGSTGPIQGALVEFNDRTETSDIDGVVNFYNNPEAISYSLKVSAIGYDDFEKSVDLFENTTDEVLLDVSKFDVSFKLFDEDKPYIDGEINFDGKTLSTVEGEVTFTDVVYGLDMEFIIQAYGHIDSIANLDVTSDLSENISLKAIKYNIEFAITDGTEPIDDVLVEFDNKNIYTDNSGISYFEQVRMDTLLTYRVRKTGYNNIINTIDVLNDSTVNLILESGIAAFKVKYIVNSETKPIYNAQVILNHDTLYTNAQGIVEFTNVAEANDISYKISKIHFNDVEGVVSVSGNNVAVEKTLSYKSYEITFSIKDGTDPIEGATISFNDKSGTSDFKGEYVFNIIYSLNQFYNISKDGYSSVVNMINIDENKTIEENLSLLTYNVTFEAVDAVSHVIENAMVEFNGATQHTDSNGKTIFTEIIPSESISFTISKDGYWNYDSTLNIVNTDVIFNARLSSVTGIISVNESDIKIYPNPSTGLFNLEILNVQNSTYIVKIYDVIGSVVYSKNIKSDRNILEQIDIKNKAKGIYFLSVESDSGSVLCKRIIIR